MNKVPDSIRKQRAGAAAGPLTSQGKGYQSRRNQIMRAEMFRQLKQGGQR
jgi:uncharacterized protein (DUF4415 family)